MQGDAIRTATPAPNHPAAPRMAVLAFLSHNLTMGCVFGSFSVLMTAVERRLGVDRHLSALAIPCITVASALLSPVAGSLAAAVSLRALFVAASLLGAAGFAVLALVPTLPAYLLAYGLLIGPAMCFAGAVLPSTLATRWFAAQRGRVLGLVHMPIVITLFPLLCTYLLRNHGLPVVYAALAGLMLVNAAVTATVIDHPPRRVDPGGHDAAAEPAADPGLTNRQLLGDARFWLLAVANCALVSAVLVLASHLAPMLTGWGMSATGAAGLVTMYTAVSMIGGPAFGWLADRLGGRTALLVLCVDFAVLLMLLALRPEMPLLAVLLALLGFHSAAGVACFGTAISQQLGPASFSRAFGLNNLINLPFVVLSVPLAASVFVRTGSYAVDLFGHAAFLLAMGAALLMAIVGGRGRRRGGEAAVHAR